MLLELIVFFLKWLRQIILYQLLTYDNYGGVSRPMWPSSRNTLERLCNIFEHISPINGTDYVCMLHKMELRLSCDRRTGVTRRNDLYKSDYRFVKRLEHIRVSGLPEEIYRTVIMHCYKIWMMLVYNFNLQWMNNFTVDRDYIHDNAPSKDDYYELKSLYQYQLKKCRKKYYKK